jgi:hypothetical protein
MHAVHSFGQCCDASRSTLMSLSMLEACGRALLKPHLTTEGAYFEKLETTTFLPFFTGQRSATLVFPR